MCKILRQLRTTVPIVPATDILVATVGKARWQVGTGKTYPSGMPGIVEMMRILFMDCKGKRRSRNRCKHKVAMEWLTRIHF